MLIWPLESVEVNIETTGLDETAFNVEDVVFWVPAKRVSFAIHRGNEELFKVRRNVT